MRYENPLYMVEDAGAADLISGGRLQLGISRGSPEQVIDGFRYFGDQPPRARPRRTLISPVITPRSSCRRSSGVGFAQPNPASDVPATLLLGCSDPSPFAWASGSGSGGAPDPVPRPNGRGSRG